MLTPETRDRIKLLRLASGLTIEDAARKAPISAIYWRHIEDGTKQNPSVTVLQRMAKALGCTVAAFYMDSMPLQKTS